MKNKPMYFSFLAVVATAITVCFIRFFQLIKFTDIQTGFVTGDDKLTYLLYIFAFVSVIFAMIYSFIAKRYKRKINFKSNKFIYVFLILLSVTYFFDFVHQVYNCNDYFATALKQSYVEYNYLLPVAMQAGFALLTCFYLIICAKSVNGSLIDFERFKLFHLMPFAWGFCRLLVIMTEIFDSQSVESLLEFVFVIFYCGFTLSCALIIDDSKKQIKPYFSFFALGLFSSSLSFSLPRILMIISGRYDSLNKATFSAITYLFIGFFAALCELFVYIIQKRDKE